MWSLYDKNIQASSIKGVVLHLDLLSLIDMGSRQIKNLIFSPKSRILIYGNWLLSVHPKVILSLRFFHFKFKDLFLSDSSHKVISSESFIADGEMLG